MHDTEAVPTRPRTGAVLAVSQIRVRLSRRATLSLIGLAAVLGGAIYGWDWLTALGVAPLLLSVLPCVAMCALGLCMSRAGQRADARDQAKPEQPAHLVQRTKAEPSSR